ncbi:helix-turn-helix domain-containing protein [Comamonas sp. E6]|uniref:helix-turn-helix domain-containing protein n=1 Tax=Comamonas sp. E6 TaxID=364029 RepID=UPI00063667C7|nr:helix-turn-helix transcriptional regulator [Comamonas sp. E6]GAO70983.1 putative transcriptional regulator [Comamonas sp. E6]
MNYETNKSLYQEVFVTFSSLFGSRLKEVRKTAGWNQAQAADISGVSREYWGRCERGDSVPGGEVLAALAAQGVDVHYVLTGERANSTPADPAEQVLLDSYRRCKPDAKANLIQTAALLSAGLAPAASPKSSAKSVPSSVKVGNLTSNHDGVVQVGYAGGKVSVKK